MYVLCHLTAKDWQTRNKRTEADLAGKCSNVEILSVHYSWCKCWYYRFISFFGFI